MIYLIDTKSFKKLNAIMHIRRVNFKQIQFILLFNLQNFISKFAPEKLNFQFFEAIY